MVVSLKRWTPHAKIHIHVFCFHQPTLLSKSTPSSEAFMFPFCLPFFHKLSKQAPQTQLGLEVLHLLSCNLYMSLKIPNHTYSWLAQSECKYSPIQQRFHEHLLCDRHHSQHRAHGRKQYTHPFQGSLRSSRTEETGKTQVYIEYSVLALYTLGIQNSQVFSVLR